MMQIAERIITYSPINMAKRQKTDQVVDDNSDKNPPLPSEPSDVARGISLAVTRRPDINEYRCTIDADIDDFPTISPPLSDSELSPLPSHKMKKKKKKSKQEKTGASTECDDDKTDMVQTDKGATLETHSQSSSEQESAMDAT